MNIETASLFVEESWSTKGGFSGSAPRKFHFYFLKFRTALFLSINRLYGNTYHWNWEMISLKICFQLLCLGIHFLFYLNPIIFLHFSCISILKHHFWFLVLVWSNDFCRAYVWCFSSFHIRSEATNHFKDFDCSWRRPFTNLSLRKQEPPRVYWKSKRCQHKLINFLNGLILRFKCWASKCVSILSLENVDHYFPSIDWAKAKIVIASSLFRRAIH